jgi:capsular exopolysaccharide family
LENNPTGNFINQYQLNNGTEDSGRDTLRDYLVILRMHWVAIALIFAAAMCVTIVYILTATNYYSTTTSIKINKPQESILSSSIFTDFGGQQADRFIANEIDLMQTYPIRQKAAKFILDTLQTIEDKSALYYLYSDPENISQGFRTVESMAKLLSDIVAIDQKRGLDVVTLVAESPSPIEATIISNLYARAYSEYSLELSRKDLTNTISFLVKEKDRKMRDLNNAEASLEDFQKRSGLINLDVQSEQLVNSISELDKAKGYAQVEITGNQTKYNELSAEIKKIDPQLVTFLEGELSGKYVTDLQAKISELELQKSIELSNTQTQAVRDKIIGDYEQRLQPLRNSLNEKVMKLEEALYVQTPEERRELIQELLLAGVQRSESKSRLNIISGMLGKYEREFSLLPSQALELAKIERQRLSSEKLYLLLEEKYQEALINQNARIGNVLITDPARVPSQPSKPKKTIVLLAGVLIGLGLGFGYAFGRNYLDRSIKNPEEIEKKGVTILAWIPSIDTLKEFKGGSPDELVVLNKSTSTAAESFKALRTRVQFSKLEEKPLKSILVTSSIPGEGKTFVSSNLASSFAIDNKKVLLLDCDLRKPRLHNVFAADRFPGLSDYLFSNVELEDIIRDSQNENLKFITAGTIPPNPSELLGSVQMKKFLELLENKFDMIVIDSPPLISVTDSEILFAVTDGGILVAKAQKTPIDVVMKSANTVNNINPRNFLGCVLNDFNVKGSYGYYYNYYYYYSKPEQKANA